MFGAEGGDGADYFACGDGIDIVLDYEPGNDDIIKDILVSWGGFTKDALLEARNLFYGIKGHY